MGRLILCSRLDACEPAIHSSSRFGRPACQCTHLRSVSANEADGRAEGAPCSSASRIRCARTSGRGSKQTFSLSAGSMISGIPPTLLARSGTPAPTHSSTVLGKLSESDEITANRPAPLKVLDCRALILIRDDVPRNGPRLGSVADVTDARTTIELGLLSQEGDLELAIGAIGAKFIQRVAKES